MKRPLMPYKPEPPQPEQDDGFADFVHDTDFLHKVNNPHFPQQGEGVHVPMWVTPKLAKELLARHGGTGHVIPHPDLKLFNK